ncbi:hypothetical protein [Sinosporangium siamense]|uniref:DUF2637 domain-containing protein n=1 Tax=Sinosporangium siamense TaxID=1367973 RepID=A0A919V3P6_9ACTN|nr:hypothetical protein [Sinosporangium siamense]GII91155.1 hypothetical protein Ssi02_13860 [Sinosporangium siamense]
MTTTTLRRPAPGGRPKGRAAKLALAASDAADVRAYDTNPDVIAYRIERMRAWVDRLIWSGMILGLAFTAVNVQQFAAAGAATYSLAWWSAWLLDPLVSLILIGALIGEQIISRHQIKAGPWVRALKWVALSATYAMNTWSAWESLDAAKILLHSVPPGMVFCAAEAVTDLRHLITEAVHAAYRAAAAPPADLAGVAEAEAPVPESRTGVARTDDVRSQVTDSTEETAEARTGIAAAPAVDAAPPAVSREQIVAELRTEILRAADRGERWAPNYTALEARTGRRRSWCEKAVRDARTALIHTEDNTAPVPHEARMDATDGAAPVDAGTDSTTPPATVADSRTDPPRTAIAA